MTVDKETVEENGRERGAGRDRAHTHAGFVDLLLLNCLQFHSGGTSKGRPQRPNRPSYSNSHSFNGGAAFSAPR